MGVKKTTRAIIEVLDADGKVTGYEAENVYVYEAESENDPMVRIAQPKTVREEVSEAEVQAIRGASGDKLTDSLREHAQQIAALQDSVRLATAAEQAATAQAQAWETKYNKLLERLTNALKADLPQ